MEEWRAVLGFEGLYEVSDEGRVRSLARVIAGINRSGEIGTRRLKGQMLKPCVDGKGRLHLDLPSGIRQVAHLVADAFVGARPRGCVLRHLDGNHLNNKPGNLEYGTYSDNTQDAIRHGTFQRGETNGRAKLTDGAVKSIRRAHALGVKQVALAKTFGVGNSVISAVVRGERWTHV